MPAATDPQFKGNSTNPSLPDLGLVGSDINGYRVKELLDQGGMSWVYEATHPEIGRRAAVKVLKAEGHNDADSRNRFLLEAKAVAALTNKHVVEIWNYGILPDGRQYLMMPLLEGESLDRYLTRLGTLPPAQALQIAEQALNALSEAHKKGIVHRDVKPGNIFLVREHTGELLVKVMDFGLAAARPVAMPEGADGPAKASWVAGTPCYVAPEQAKGLAASPAADLYALGVTLYELLAGEPPFPDSPDQPVAELLRKHLSEPPPRLSRKVANLPEGLEEFVNSLLEKDPAKRPASADLARTQAQRLLKRLASDATAVKGMVLPSAPSLQPVRQGTEKVLGPPPADLVSVEVAKAEKKRPGAVVAVLLLLLLFGGLGIWKLASGTGEPKVTAPPVVPEPPKVAAVVKVEEPEKVAQPEKVPEPPEPVKTTEPEPLAVPVKKPIKVTIKEPGATQTVVETCSGDDEWKKSARDDLKDLQKLAIGADRYEEWTQIEPKLKARIDASGPGTCEQLDQEIHTLALKYQAQAVNH